MSRAEGIPGLQAVEDVKISSETAVAVIEQHDDEASQPECQLDLALRRVQAQGHVDEKQAPGSRFNASW
jgi:hypothetical protein